MGAIPCFQSRESEYFAPSHSSRRRSSGSGIVSASPRKGGFGTVNARRFFEAGRASLFSCPGHPHPKEEKS